MRVTDSEISCGIKQISGLNGFTSLTDDGKSSELKTALRNFWADTRSVYIFSDAVNNRNGAALAAFIRKKNLGHVPPAKKVVNSNTGRIIQLFVWYTNRGAVNRWLSR